LLSNISILTVSDEGYSRNVSCALSMDRCIYVFIIWDYTILYGRQFCKCLYPARKIRGHVEYEFYFCFCCYSIIFWNCSDSVVYICFSFYCDTIIYLIIRSRCINSDKTMPFAIYYYNPRHLLVSYLSNIFSDCVICGSFVISKRYVTRNCEQLYGKAINKLKMSYIKE